MALPHALSPSSSVLSVCLGLTVELPPKKSRLPAPIISDTTLRTHTHLPSPNRNTPLAVQSGHSPCKATPPLGPAAKLPHFAAPSSCQHVTQQRPPARASQPKSAMPQSALVTQPRLFFRTPLHPVRPVWSGASPTPDKRGWNNHVLARIIESRRANIYRSLIHLYQPPNPPTSAAVAETLDGATAGRSRETWSPLQNRRALCRAKFISQTGSKTWFCRLSLLSMPSEKTITHNLEFSAYQLPLAACPSVTLPNNKYGPKSCELHPRRDQFVHESPAHTVWFLSSSDQAPGTQPKPAKSASSAAAAVAANRDSQPVRCPLIFYPIPKLPSMQSTLIQSTVRFLSAVPSLLLLMQAILHT